MKRSVSVTPGGLSIVRTLVVPIATTRLARSIAATVSELQAELAKQRR